MFFCFFPETFLTQTQIYRSNLLKIHETKQKMIKEQAPTPKRRRISVIEIDWNAKVEKINYKQTTITELLNAKKQRKIKLNEENKENHRE